MVKRSRDQSQDAPSRLSWLTMVPPDSAFHAHTRSKEPLAAEIAARRLLPLHELALDHHLRRDPGVIGAGLPQHVAPAHALEPAEHVLQRVVERVAHMQRAGDVGRRNDEAIGLRVAPLRPAGAERLRRLPGGRDSPFDVGGLIGLLDHGVRFQRLGADVRRAGLAQQEEADCTARVNIALQSATAVSAHCSPDVVARRLIDNARVNRVVGGAALR